MLRTTPDSIPDDWLLHPQFRIRPKNVAEPSYGCWHRSNCSAHNKNGPSLYRNFWTSCRGPDGSCPNLKRGETALETINHGSGNGRCIRQLRSGMGNKKTTSSQWRSNRATLDHRWGYMREGVVDVNKRQVTVRQVQRRKSNSDSGWVPDKGTGKD